MILAQPSFWDNDVLDKWTIPFGRWIEEIVFWLTTHLEGPLDAIRWPVDKLLDLVIDEVLLAVPWPFVLIFFVLLGTATRNFKVGLGSAGALLVCGLLGQKYWDLTMETVGMIIVSVFICSILGIPLGVLAARVDSFWKRLRPILDGMQVIHPFVYLLPIIFLFGLRRGPGVLATLVFALPPIVRLTNLGIRQVPTDVVEAARAFGASESRVLREVQLPLARPAIMAGLNQTLLLSLSMVGIVAIIAGGGLGGPILEALNTGNIPLGASAGLGLYFVGVLLDRISQPEAGDNRANLFARMQNAWTSRKNPVVPAMPSPVGDDSDAELLKLMSGNQPIALSLVHQIAVQGAVIGGVAAAFGTLITWADDAGRISAYVTAADADLAGAHNGLSAAGGSWFGILVMAIGVTIALTGIVTMAVASSRTSSFTQLSTFVAGGIGILALVGAYLSVPAESAAHSTGIGVWFSLGGGALILLPALFASSQIELNPRRAGIKIGGVIGMAALSLFVLFAGARGSWIDDQRNNAMEIAARLAAESDGEGNQGGLAAELLAEAMAATTQISILGMDSDGPRIGYSIAALVGLAVLLTLARYGLNARIQRVLSFVLYGIGFGLISIAVAWIATIVRLQVNQVAPGASAFLTACGGAILMTIAHGQISAHEVRVKAQPALDETQLDDQDKIGSNKSLTTT